MIGGRDVVCFSSIDWQYLWQVHQEVMSRFSCAGNRVLYVESTGLRAPGIRDVPRLWRRVQQTRGAAPAPHPTHGVEVLSPVVLPFPYSPAARAFNRRRLLPRVQRWSAGRAAPIAWIFLPTPLSLELARAIEPVLTVYYCVDDLRHSSRAARRVADSEDQLLRDADVVLVTSEALRDHARRFRSDVHLLPAGVDVARMETAGASPEDLATIRRPRVAYVGGQPAWLDRALLGAVTRLMPDVQFVFIGPDDLPELAALPNVHVLGARPHTAIPGYLYACDAAVIPYARTTYTDAIYPAKLHEYLAAGLPVVATSIRELRAINATHGDVVRIADAPEAFAGAIRTAIADRDSSARRAAARNLARVHDWPIKIAAIDAVLEAALAARGAA